MPPVPPPPTPVEIFSSTEQTCINECPEGTIGDPISVTVSAGTFHSTVSQEAADAAALAAACAEALALREASPCEDGSEATIAFESEEILATLVGISEYANPSLPPKKYLVQTAMGEINTTDKGYPGVVPGGLDCANPIANASREVDSGTYSIDPNTEVATNLQIRDLYGPTNAPDITPQGASYTSTSPLTLNYATVTDDPGLQLISSKTTRRWIFGPCWLSISFDAFGFPIYVWRTYNGMPMSRLSSEDTEDDAISRATPVPGVSNIAAWQLRGAGEFSFTIRRVTITIDCSNLQVGQTYGVKVDAIQESYGGGGALPTAYYYEFVASGPTHQIIDTISAVPGTQITLGAVSISSGSVPSSPSLLTVTPNDVGNVLALSWTQGQAYSSQVIYRSTDGVTYNPLVVISGALTGYDDSDVQRGVTYYYKIKGANVSNVLSGFSNADSGALFALVSASVDATGLIWTLTISAAASFGAGGNGGFVVATTASPPITLAYVSGAGTSVLVFSGSRAVFNDEYATLDYTNPGNGVETSAGFDLPSLTDFEVELLGQLDADVLNWKYQVLGAGGTFENDSVELANNFMLEFKAQGFDAHVKYLLAFLGADVLSFSAPLPNSLFKGRASNHGFVDADCSQSVGMQSDGAKRFELKVRPTELGGAPKYCGFGYWETNMPAIASYAMGARDISLLQLYLDPVTPREVIYSGYASDETAGMPTNGHYYVQSKNSTDLQLFKDGVSILLQPVNSGSPFLQDPIFNLCALDGVFFGSGRPGVAYLTDGQMSDMEISAFHAFLEDYLMTPTGRI